MNLRNICDKFEILNYDEITPLLEITEPIVTIAMLSFKRFNILIKALKQHLENGTPLNMVLRVQCCEDLSDNQRTEIETLIKQFAGYDLQFTETNLGSGIPRHDVMNRAITNFNTPYILTTDDDMIWKPYSIMTQVSLLERMPEYGIISSTCNPNYPRKWKDKNGVWKTANITQPFVDADMIGSATSVYRREIFKTCEYDKEYTIGCGDYDLCMQIRQSGWKIGVLNVPQLKSLNDNKANTKEYRQMRYNRKTIDKSVILFKKKWGLDL